MKKFSIAVLAVAAAVAFSPIAKADSTESFTSATATFDINSDETVSVNQFDTSLGTLQSVTVTLWGTTSSTFTQSFGTTGHLHNPTGTLTGFGETANLYASGANLQLAISATDTLASTQTFYGAGSYTSPTPFQPAISSVSTGAVTTGLTGYEGTGQVFFDLTGDETTHAQYTTTGGESDAGGHTVTNGIGYVTVSYDYTTPQTLTPEPSSMFLLGTGLLGLAGLVFGKKNGFSRNM